MKRSYLLLATFATVSFLLIAGCGDAPTTAMNAGDPAPGESFAGKNNDKGGGGGGKTSNYLSVELTSGAVTASAFIAKVSSDSDSKIQFNNDDANRFDVQIQLLAAWDEGNASSCTLVGDESFRGALVAQLNKAVAGARAGFQVDKLSFGSPSDVNNLNFAYEDPDRPELGTIRLGIPAHGNPPPTVEEALVEGARRDYLFHSGVVRVWATRSGGPKDDVKLFCDNPAPADGGDTILVSTTAL